MFDSMPRLVALIVAACVALTVLVIVRSRQASELTAPAPVPGSINSSKGAPGRPGHATSSFGSAGGSFEAPRPGSGIAASGSEGGGVAPPIQLGKAGENTVASADGRNLAAEPLPQRSETQGVPHGAAIDGSTGGGRYTKGFEPVGVPQADLPEGTRFAAALKDNGTAADGTDPIVEQNVQYDVGDGAYFPPDSRFAYPNNGGVVNDHGSVVFWVQPVDWDGGDPTDNSLVQLRNPGSWANRLQIFKNGPYLRFLFTPDTGQETNVGQDIRTWKRGEWHFVAASWGDSITTMYVDGRQIGQGPYEGELDVPDGTPLYVGSDLPGGADAAGAIVSQFAVLDYVITSEDAYNMSQTPPKS